MKIKLFWSGGFKTPSDECKFMLSRGYVAKSQKEIQTSISKLPKVPKWHTGFIPDEYFYSRRSRPFVGDTSDEVKDAFSHAMKMQCNVPFNELSAHDYSSAVHLIRQNLIIKFLLELLLRNKNVELILGDDDSRLVLNLLGLGDDNIGGLYSYLSDFDSDDSINNIITKLDLKNNTDLTIEFNPKQGVHTFVGYPRY